MSIISNGIAYFQLSNIKALEVGYYVEAILISEQEGIGKPDSQIFINACARLKVLPEECVFVVDYLINVVEGACQVGITGVLKTNSKKENPDIELKITHLKELPVLIDSL